MSMRVHLVDFASTRSWPPTNKKKRNRGSTKKIGTAKYASLALHKGKEPTPQTDIESLSYLLLDLLHGSLPWSGVLQKNWTRIGELKDEAILLDLIEGLPVSIMRFVDCARAGGRKSVEYGVLKGLLREALVEGVEVVGGEGREKGRERGGGWARVREGVGGSGSSDGGTVSGRSSVESG
ncbi:hypothetical protein HDV00_012813 [Rhizophlyctis rosea]|nr:hypothetical protein HDV00_012813 [Rhizophlyctis rosea]